jgi:predicted transcriptional regulator
MTAADKILKTLLNNDGKIIIKLSSISGVSYPYTIMIVDELKNLGFVDVFKENNYCRVSLTTKGRIIASHLEKIEEVINGKTNSNKLNDDYITC